MREKLKFHCPCGYGFEFFGIMNDAISRVKLHVESFHVNDLPFGITNEEAKMLLQKETEEKKPKMSSVTADLTESSPKYNFRNTEFTLQSLLEKLLGEDFEVAYKRKGKEKVNAISNF